MLPLQDDTPRETTPYVNYGLILVNVLVFLYEVTLGPGELQRMFLTLGVVPRDLWLSLQALENGHTAYWYGLVPLVTSMFMHGGWMHLGGNMLFLWIFGDNIDDRLGHAGYLAFYMLAGIVAGLGQAWASPDSLLPSLGASGAIGGVLGAYIVLFPQARITTLVFLGFFLTTVQVPALFFLGLWFVLQAIHGVASLGAATAQTGGVAFWAHVAGFVTGTVVGAVSRAVPPSRVTIRSRHAARWYSNRR